MSPLVLIRGVTGLALPLALLLAHRRRHGSHETREDEGFLGTAADEVELSAGLRGSTAARATRSGEGRSEDFRRAMFDRTVFAGRDLSHVDASYATFMRCNLAGCRLVGASLDFADFSRSDLRDADFSDASLLETNLWRTDLRGARLRGARGIALANVRGAQYNRSTTWPPGFDPAAAGARLVSSG